MRSAGSPCRIDAPVEGDQLPAVLHREAKKVAVREMLCGREIGKIGGIAETHVIRPELVAGGRFPLLDGRASRLGAARTTGKPGISEDPDKSILRDRAGGPTFGRGPFEKRFRRRMKRTGGVGEKKQ